MTAPDEPTDDDLTDVLADYLMWAAETFPWETERDALALVEREVREFLAEPCMDEAADCVMVLSWWADRSGRTVAGLAAALRHKLAVNRERTWVKPEGGGPVQHAEVERLRAAAPASDDDAPISACPASISGTCLQMVEGFGPCDDVCERKPETAGSPPPTPAPTREQIHSVLEELADDYYSEDAFAAAEDRLMALLSAAGGRDGDA